MTDINFTWKFDRIHPRLDIKLSSPEEKEFVEAVLLQYPYRNRTSKINTRRYKMPIRFHLKFFRDKLEAQLTLDP